MCSDSLSRLSGRTPMFVAPVGRELVNSVHVLVVYHSASGFIPKSSRFRETGSEGDFVNYSLLSTPPLGGRGVKQV